MYKKRCKAPPFVMVEKEMLRSPEWQELSSSAKIVYIHLKSKYNGHNAENLRLPYKEMEKQFAPSTIAKAFKDLEDRGWVKKEQHGGLYRHYNLYSLSGKWGRLI